MEVKTVIHHKYSRTLCMNCSYVESYHITGLERPLGLQHVEVPEFLYSRHVKVVRLSVLGTFRLYRSGDIPGIHICLRLRRHQGHNIAGRIKSVKNPSDLIGNRNRGLVPRISAPQSTAPRLLYAVPNMADVRNFEAVTNQIKSYRTCTCSPHVSP